MLRLISKGRRPDTDELVLAGPERHGVLDTPGSDRSRMVERVHVFQPSAGSSLDRLAQRVRERERSQKEAERANR